MSNFNNKQTLPNSAHIKRKKYVPSLKNFMALCEQNYANLMRLLPAIEPQGFYSSFSVNEHLAYQIEVKEVCKFTTMVECAQIQNGLPEYLRPVMQVRLYHDARVAEVTHSQNVSRIQGSYDYPNDKMHHQDEKLMINLFLKEWLGFCISHGRSNIEVSF